MPHPRLTPRRTIVGCALLATLLCLPALGVGFFSDDFIQLARLEGWSTVPGPRLDLFTFFPGGDSTTQMIAQGPAPWWSHPDLKMSFWRPVSSGLAALEHALFGRQAVLHHAVSLLWHAVLVVAAGLLFRRALPRTPALWGLALLMFAVDDAHWMAAGWLAARNAMLSLVAVLFALLAYRRWREEGWRPGLVLGLLGAALGLLAGESGISALAYLLSYELVGAPPPRPRLGGLAPFVALIAGFLAFYKLGGHGVAGSGAYLDPVGSPLAFVAATAERVPALLANVTFGLPVEVWTAAPVARPFFTVAGLFAVVLVGLWLRAALRRLPDEDARGVRWLALGGLLALFPSSAALMGERLVLVATLGAAPVFAVLVRDGWHRLRDRAARLPRRLAAVGGLIAVALPNVVLAPVLLPAKLLMLSALSQASVRLATEAEVAPDKPVKVVVLWAADPLAAISSCAAPCDPTSTRAGGHGGCCRWRPCRRRSREPATARSRSPPRSGSSPASGSGPSALPGTRFAAGTPCVWTGRA